MGILDNKKMNFKHMNNFHMKFPKLRYVKIRCGHIKTTTSYSFTITLPYTRHSEYGDTEVQSTNERKREKQFFTTGVCSIRVF